MKIILCDSGMTDALCGFYGEVTLYLEQHINYPKWTHAVYPARGSITHAIESLTQYACIDGGSIVGAFVLNRDPQGNYDVGDWSRQLKIGEYLVVHSLAVLPSRTGEGIASYMMNYVVEYARKQGAKAVRLDIVPSNYPAKKLYENCGFRYAGEYNLERGFEEIPSFCLYELNL